MKKTIFIAILILAVAAGIFGAVHTHSTQVYAKLSEWKLIPIPERFTELYFVTYPTLAPSTVKVGLKVPFSFEIHNVEGEDREYPYMVYFKGLDQRTTLIDRGVISLKNGEKELKTESFTVSRTSQLGNVIVYLTEMDRYVYFSVPNRTLVLEATPHIYDVATSSMGTTTSTTTYP